VTISDPRVLVVSIFAPSEWNRSWYALQQRFLGRNSTGIDLSHRVYLNGVAPEAVGDDLLIAGQSLQNSGHSAALREVVELFRRSRDHDYFLILDSDCFPVHPDWLGVLSRQMTRFGKHFAAPLRVENLDRFPHPCAFLIAGSAVHDPRINFDVGHVAPNLIGEPVSDVGNAMLDLIPDLLPLIRTNLRNRHPVAAAIYNHLFYHHGAGSREFQFRVTHKFDYLSHWWDSAGDRELGRTLSREIFADPERFVAELMEGSGEPTPRDRPRI
jgi:hypothetical protein